LCVRLVLLERNQHEPQELLTSSISFSFILDKEL
jgi:hypothetical protein